MTDPKHAQQTEFLARLDAFRIDGPGEAPDFTFAQRLARENGWSEDFAERVVTEYKRFVFLCVKAGHPCTPSEHVDQAWHLHLTFTESYWERMCGEVLNRPLHHNPTKGGNAEKDKFDDWYARTKESYERLLGNPPPADIWPHHAERFGTDLMWERVNTASHWVIRKPKRSVLAMGGSAAAAVLIAAGCATTTGNGGDVATGVIFFLIAAFLIVFLIWAVKNGNGGGRGGGCGFGGGCAGCGGCGGCGG